MGAGRPGVSSGKERLSPASTRTWVLSQLFPESPQWSVPVFLRLPMGIADDSVRQALGVVTARHDALRARWAADGAHVWRTTAGACGTELRVARLEVAELMDAVRHEMGRRFDLDQGPLVRALLARVPGEAPILVAVLHRLAAEAVPPALLMAELAGLLGASHQPGLPVRAGLEEHCGPGRGYGAADESVAYWRDRLGGLVPLDLPTDKPRPPRWDGHGAAISFTLPASAAKGVARIAQQASTTEPVVLLAAFAAVTARHAGQWDMNIGSPVGHPAHPVVWRIRLDGSMTFRDAVGVAHRSQERAARHPMPPFERLLAALAPERDLSQAPVFQLAFEFAADGQAVASGADDLIAALAFGAASEAAHTDLAMSVSRAADGSVRVVLGYAVSLFHETTVRRFAGHFERFLTSVAEDPDAALARVDILAETEHGQVHREWTGAATVRDLRLPTVIEQFEANAARSPSARAVKVSDGGEVSYAQLNARADRLARGLAELGAGPGTYVGVLLGRGGAMMAGLLAVGKAGAAYVPIDPALPADRISYMLDDCGAQVVVTESAYADKAGGFPGTCVLVDEEGGPAPGTTARRKAGPDPDDTAYLVYTSGSTGRPKGVKVTHRSLANHVQWAATALVRERTAGAALFSSIAFDLVVPTLWAPLVTGRAVFVVTQDGTPADLDAMVSAGERLSFLKMTPGQLEVLSAQLGEQRVAALTDYVVVGGEVLPGSMASKWLEVLGPGRLINEYGPTEATVGTCVYPVSSPVEQEVTPIGRPLPNMSMFVLDPAMRPVPAGVVGELYVGGTGVALGYHGQPELTAERFVTAPAELPAGRLYRTGDLARWLPTGDLAFVGRADDQLKIRGYRVEPDEVGAVLTRCPGISAAAVLAVGADARNRRLVAFYVPDPGLVPAVDALESHCAAQLPAYMIPADYVAVPALPRTANGKIDRPALLAALERGKRQEPPRPRTELANTGPALEDHIAAVWAALLGNEPGRSDRFFDAGGDSVLAVQFSARLSAALGSPVPPWALFAAPTPERLASFLDDTAAGGLPPDADVADGTEDLIRAAFEEVLDVRYVAPDDSFFTIGGDSIVAFKLLSAVRKRGVSFDLADLYALHTPRSLAGVATHEAPAALSPAAEREFWRGYLAGYESHSRLFADFDAKDGRMRVVESVSRTWDRGLSGRSAGALASQDDWATLRYAAIAVLTAKLRQHGDVVLAVAAGSGLDGPRGGPVPLRCPVDPSLTVAEFLGAVRTGISLISDHCRLSLEEVCDAAGIGLPLQVLVATGESSLDQAGRFDLSFEFVDAESSQVTVRHDAALFRPETAGRLADAAGRLLDFFLTRPHDRIGQALLVASEDRRALGALWNDVAGPPLRFDGAAIGALINAPAWEEFVGQVERNGLLSALLLAL